MSTDGDGEPDLPEIFVIREELMALSREEWTLPLRQGGLQLRQELGRALKVALTNGQLNSDLLKVKLKRVRNPSSLLHIAGLLILPVKQAALDLLTEDSQAFPTVQDWRQIWAPLSSAYSPRLVRLLLCVAVADGWPTAATARAFLEEIGPSPESYAAPVPDTEPAGLRGDADRLDEIGRGIDEIHSLLRSPSEQTRTAAVAALSSRLEAASRLLVEHELEVDFVGPILESIARNGDLLRERAADRDRELAKHRTSQSRRKLAEAADILAPLRTVSGPEGYEYDVEKLRQLAVPPTDEEQAAGWLEHVPVLAAFIDQLSGGRPLDQAEMKTITQLSTPAVIGLAFDQLTLSSSPPAVLPVATPEPAAQPTPKEVAPPPPPPPPPPPQVPVPAPAVELAPAPGSTPTPAPVLASESLSERETRPEPEMAFAALLAADPGSETIEPQPQAPDAAEVWTALRRLVEDNQLGVAAWAANAYDREWGTALEVLAIADGLRGNAGALSELLWTRIQDLRKLPDGPACQVLCAALCLAATVAPFSGAADVLDEAAEHAPVANGLRNLCSIVVKATRLGFVIDSGSLPAARSATRSTAAVEALKAARAAARQQLAIAESRRIKYQRATRVYQRWMADDGVLGSLLIVVRDDDRARMDDVRQRSVLLNDREIGRAIDVEDARLRSANSTGRIIAAPRQKLAEWAREALEIVDSWIRAVAALPQESGRHSTDDLGEEVRAAALAVAGFQAEEHSEGQPAELDLACLCVRSVGHLLVSRIQHGLPDEAELPVPELLDSWLPFVPEAALGRDSWPAVPKSALAGLLVAPYRSPESVYLLFEQKWDHAGTARLLEALAARGVDTKVMATRRERDLREARAAMRRRAARIQDEFDQLEAFPQALDSEQALVIRGLLVDTGGTADDDLLAGAERLAAADQVLGQVRREQEELLVAEMDERQISTTDRAAVLELLRDGALSAAHERLDAAWHHLGQSTLPGPSYDELQQRFWSSNVSAAEQPGIIAQAIQALNGGLEMVPFGLGPVEPTERQANANALQAWTELFQHKREGDFERRLVAVLGLLSLRGPTPREDTNRRLRGNHLMLDIVNGTPVLPVMSFEFGSSANGRYRIVVVWERLSPEELVSLVLNDHKSGPYVVLYGGVLSVRQRQALMHRARREDAAAKRFLVIDDAVALTMAFAPDPSFATLEHLTLPFGQAAVFAPDVAGNVPPELFRGRRRELAEVISPLGGCFVYGGRQVGKSALLRQAFREIEQAEDPDRRAVYLDVKGLGLGLWRDADEFWLELLEELGRLEIVTDRSSKAARGEATVSHIRNWLEAEPARRLLVLLDECDELLDADATKDFAIIERLRRLMSVTDRRFKVVLAGLHQVQRFERQRNVPLAHLTQQPIQVGPLQPGDAVSLIREPLLAFGYALDDGATWRLLAETNHQAGMIQYFGQALLRALNERQVPRDAFPLTVDRAFVDRVYAAQGLADQMRRRFMLTINLDERYRCIAFVIALRNLQDGMMADYDQRELQTDCAYWWPLGFESLRPTLFQELVEEMIGLGVLAKVGEQIRIRNPNVVRMLGSQSQVEAELIEFETVQPMREFEPSQYRRQLPDRRRSPLSEEELARLVEIDEPGLALIGGSVALGIEKVQAAVTEKLKGRTDIELIIDSPESAAERIAQASGRTVIVADCRALSPERILVRVEAVQAALDRMPHNTAMRRVLFVLGPQAHELWATPHKPRAALKKAVLIGLRRLTASSLRAWSTEESLEMDRSAAEAVLRQTGGWPILVDQTIGRRRNHEQDWAEAAAEVRAAASQDAGFVTAVLGQVPDVAELAAVLRDLGEPVSWPDLADLGVPGSAVPSDAPSRSGLEATPDSGAREGMEALQLVDEMEDGSIRLEPVFVAAWTELETR